MKKILLLVGVTLLSYNLMAQQYQWAKAFNGGLNFIEDCKVDAAGNSFIAGNLGDVTSGSIDLDPGPGTHIINAANGSVFFAKYSPSGALVWAKQLNVSAIHRLRLDAAGDVYLAGNFGNNLPPQTSDFDPDAGVTNLTAWGQDLFIAKYSGATGALTWAKQIQTATNSSNVGGVVDIAAIGFHQKGNTFEIDNNGDITICGSFRGEAEFDLNSDWGGAVYDGESGFEFLIKYDAGGNIIWHFFNGISTENIGFAVKNDSQGNTYYLSRASFYNPTATDFNAIVIDKILNNGTASWRKKITLDNQSTFNAASQLNPEYARDIRLDSAGNFYLHGQFRSDIDFDPGPATATLVNQISATHDFLAKYDAEGNYIWAKVFGGTSPSSLNTLEISANNRLITTPLVTETFTGSGIGGDLDMGPGSTPAIGHFIAQYDTAANLIGYKKLDGVSSIASTRVLAIQEENIFLADNFADSIDCDLATPNGSLYSTSNYSCYLAKYNQCLENINSVDTTICQGDSYTLGTQVLTTSGTYSHTFTVNNCDSVVILNLAITAIDTMVAQNNNTLTANASDVSYQWLDCATNTPVPGANSKNFTPTASGSYKVVITSSNCSDTSGCHTVGTIGIAQPELMSRVSIYPNPVTEQLQISYPLSLIIKNISISDITGKILSTLTPATSLGVTTIDTRSLAPGVYLLRITGSGERAQFKFVKQ